jgi:hypothetical protein
MGDAYKRDDSGWLSIEFKEPVEVRLSDVIVLAAEMERLKALRIEGGESIEAKTPSARWPWGNHHTEWLGHLEAAAKRWWSLYDPTDATTAPTNTNVSDWLQKERGLSQTKADAMASILRPDGLRTGPRK